MCFVSVQDTVCFYFNWRFIFFHHIIYIMWRLYYILFVYLKSFKELTSVFKSESGCKGKRFIFTVQIFLKFFSKIFFRQVPECVSRSLAAWQGKILGHTEITTGFLSLCHRQSLSLSKAGAKLRTFFFHAILYDTFFSKKLWVDA